MPVNQPICDFVHLQHYVLYDDLNFPSSCFRVAHCSFRLPRLSRKKRLRVRIKCYIYFTVCMFRGNTKGCLDQCRSAVENSK